MFLLFLFWFTFQQQTLFQILCFFFFLFCIYQLIVKFFKRHYKNYKTCINIISKCSKSSDTLSVNFCILFLLGCVCLYLLPRDSPPRILCPHVPRWTSYSPGPPYCHLPDFLFAFTLGHFFSVFNITSHVQWTFVILFSVQWLNRSYEPDSHYRS